MKSSCLYTICCLKTILDEFWQLKNVLKELSCCWCVPGICRCKDFTAETIPKNIKGFTRISYLFWKCSRERKLGELSSIRCLTFCVIDGRPIIAENWCVINEFCNRGRDEKMIFWYYSPQRKCQTKFLQFLWQKGLLSLS